jgi:hypothetical protein
MKTPQGPTIPSPPATRRPESGVPRQVSPELPLAHSVSGKAFGFEAPLPCKLNVGSYVRISTNQGTQYLGQILYVEGAEYALAAGFAVNAPIDPTNSQPRSQQHPRIQIVRGTGQLLKKRAGQVLEDTTRDDVFADAEITEATAGDVTDYLSVDEAWASLDVGRVSDADALSIVSLNARGFDRHSFLCGQSGSGKTFALGVIIEQLLVRTQLRIVIIDPNSDFVHLNKLRSKEDINKTLSAPLDNAQYDVLKARFDAISPSIRVLRSPSSPKHGNNMLQIRFSDLDWAEQAALLRMDPVTDRKDYHLLKLALAGLRGEYSLNDVQDRLTSLNMEGVGDLNARIANLGIDRWPTWCSTDECSLIDLLAGDDRCLVVDVGTSDSEYQRAAVCASLLSYFWRHRYERRPTLIVIDEAHYVCPQESSLAIESIVTEDVVRIASEGRKFGLYLLMATQRPDRIHANAVSQCDNLVLMRVNSNLVLDTLSQAFSQAPRALLQRASQFGLGQALLMGRIVPTATLAKFEGRITREGGKDLPATWARRLGG